MAVFSSGGVGLDLGSANITICLENEGIVLREPSYILAMRENSEEVLGVGRDARQMLGRTPRDVVLQWKNESERLSLRLRREQLLRRLHVQRGLQRWTWKLPDGFSQARASCPAPFRKAPSSAASPDRYRRSRHP